MTDLPLSNFININITKTPQGLGEPDVNSLLLLTTEKPSNLDDYRIYLNPTQVATDYGSGSKTYEMANAIFSQNPNILAGDGRLVIAPFVDAASATIGEFETDDISANIASLLAVVDGDLKVTVDGNENNLTDLDFSSAATLADIATILQKKLSNAIVTASADKIKFTSKTVGAASTIALGSVAGGTGTDLTGAGLLNAAAGTATDGQDSSGETIVAAVNRLKNEVAFVGIITDLEIENAVLKSTAEAIQPLDNIFVHSISSTEELSYVQTNITEAELSKTRIFFYGLSVDSAKKARAAYAGRGFSVNFQGSSTLQTLHGKSLAGVISDDVVTQTILDTAGNAGVDVYASFGGLAKLFTSGANSYFDEIYFDLWLKLALEVAGFNILTTLSTKIPQTEQGMEVLLGAYIDVLEQAVRNGGIGRGLQWNSGDTFGNLEDFHRNIKDYGYYAYYLPIAQQSQADRAARKAPLIQIAIKRAGAIHKSDVSVIIEA